MKIPIIFESEPDCCELLNITDKLGEGKFTVYTAYSPAHGTNYALKVFPNTFAGVMHYTKEQILANLCHPNIIKCIPTKCQTDTFLGVLTEYAEHGEILELAAKGAFSSETLIRTYFHQLIEGIEYLHLEGLAHLDLKLHNLVLGSDYKLKIIDFDQAQSIADTKMKFWGTKAYRPPEVIDNKCKNLAAVDVYSAGVILYALIANEFPFMEVIDKKGIRLKHYSTFVKDKNLFWQSKANTMENKNVFSGELIELLNGMFEYDVEKRFKIEEVKKSKWFNGPIMSEDELIVHMKDVLANIKAKK